MSNPDFTLIARERYGLDAATYNIDDAARHLGSKPWYVWKLVREGALRTIKLPGGRKTVVPRDAIAELLWHRDHEQPAPSQAARINTAEATAKRKVATERARQAQKQQRA
jgi:hypothetical protein